MIVVLAWQIYERARKYLSKKVKMLRCNEFENFVAKSLRRQSIKKAFPRRKSQRETLVSP